MPHDAGDLCASGFDTVVGGGLALASLDEAEGRASAFSCPQPACRRTPTPQHPVSGYRDMVPCFCRGTLTSVAGNVAVP